MRKPLRIQNVMDGQTDIATYRPTNLLTDTARCRVMCLRIKTRATPSLVPDMNCLRCLELTKNDLKCSILLRLTYNDLE